MSGLIGSGKDTAADYLCNFHGFRRESWANSLKDAIAVVFGWDRILLEGRTNQAREWREQVDHWWADRLNLPLLTPRWVLQYWGTEVCRLGFHDDIWIASLENKMRKTGDNIVISDCRFPNELASIKRLGGMTIRIVRGEEPAWLALAKTDISALNKAYPQIHASEYSSVGLQYDHVLDNNATVDSLHTALNDLLQSHQSSK